MKLDDKKAIFGWAMYDWANSAFATTITATFFPLFFAGYWNEGVPITVVTDRLGNANSLAGIIVALMAPVLGAIADRGSAKKKFLLFFAYMGVVMTSCLYFVAKDNWILAAALYVFALIGFAGGNIFYDSLITGVASEKKIDFVSALGYSLGYLGGGILFALNVFMVKSPGTFGLADQTEAFKVAFVTVGIWWAVFSIPVFLLVKEPEYGEGGSGLELVKAGFAQFRETFREIRHLKTIFLFLLAYFLYIDGVDTVVVMAVNYGRSLGFNNQDLIVAILIVQFVGFPAAIGFGYLGGRIGPKPAVFIGLTVYLFVSVWASFMQSSKDFYILAIIVGLVQGGVQALSRSFYAKIIPADKSAQYFGFYNMLGKFATIIGPQLIGKSGRLLVVFWGFSEITASRASIPSISLLFVVGGILLYFVNENKGRQEAKYLSKD